MLSLGNGRYYRYTKLSQLNGFRGRFFKTIDLDYINQEWDIYGEDAGLLLTKITDLINQNKQPHQPGSPNLDQVAQIQAPGMLKLSSASGNASHVNSDIEDTGDVNRGHADSLYNYNGTKDEQTTKGDDDDRTLYGTTTSQGHEGSV